MFVKVVTKASVGLSSVFFDFFVATGSTCLSSAMTGDGWRCYDANGNKSRDLSGY
jgi:hypothetical protein